MTTKTALFIASTMTIGALYVSTAQAAETAPAATPPVVTQPAATPPIVGDSKQPMAVSTQKIDKGKKGNRRRAGFIRRWEKMTPVQREEFLKKHPKAKPPSEEELKAARAKAAAAKVKTPEPQPR